MNTRGPQGRRWARCCTRRRSRGRSLVIEEENTHVQDEGHTCACCLPGLTRFAGGTEGRNGLAIRFPGDRGGDVVVRGVLQLTEDDRGLAARRRAISGYGRSRAGDR
jgi:hypothetical protein